MLFELVEPWTEWMVDTEIGKRSWNAKLDTGAFITLVGINIAREFGLTIDFIKKQKCVRYIGVVENTKGYAFKVPCVSIPLGDEIIPIKEIFVPFNFIDKTKYSFTSEDRYLIGTDVLNNYKISIDYRVGKNNNVVNSISIELTPHKLILPKRKNLEYTITQLAGTIGEVDYHAEDSNVLHAVE